MTEANTGGFNQGVDSTPLSDINNEPIDATIPESRVIPENPTIPIEQQLTEANATIEELTRQLAEANATIEAVRQQCIIDDLTGLHNHRYLADYIENFDKSRIKKPVIVVFCDVDNLGAINKLKGHNFGDQLLINVATSIQEIVRSEDIIMRKDDDNKDMVTRKGGDEFVIIIENFLNFQETKDKISERLRSSQTPDTRFSFGIVQYDPVLDKSLSDTIQRGDNQMKEDYPNKKIPKH